MTRAWSVLLALALGACVESSVITCDDGTLCPERTICDLENGRCLTDQQVRVCDGLDENAPCVFAAVPGRCRHGACEPLVCGDGARNGNEQCDGPDLDGETCASLGFDGETTGLSCGGGCRFDTTGCSGICGDGVADPDEQCDAADLRVGIDCTSLGFYDAPGLACTPLCTFDFAACTGYCGDGIVDDVEECDGTDLAGATCTAEGFYDPAGLTCSPACSRNVSACTGSCGDLVVNGPELCDGAPPTESCFDLGYDAGALACSGSCGASFATCARFGWRIEPVGFPILAIGGPQRETTWIVGTAGRTARFVGNTWVTVTTPITGDLRSVSVLGPLDAWAVSTAAVVRWNGVAWQQQLGVPVGGYNEVLALGPSAVVLSTDTAGVIRWDGLSWQPVGDIGIGSVGKIGGTSITDLWAARPGELVHWDGATWSPAYAGEIRTIIARAADDVWIGGRVSSMTSDGFVARWDGQSWTTWSNPSRAITSLAVTAGNDVWAAAGTMLRHYDGTRWTDLPAQSQSPNTIGQLVSYGVDEVVGSAFNGFAFRYRGQTYFPYGGTTTNISKSLWSSSTTDVFVGDIRGTVQHWNGLRWEATVLDPDPGVRVEDLWGSAPDHVWAVTSGGDAYRFDGTSWTIMLQVGSLQSVWGTGPSDVWVFGSGGVRHFDGAVWTVRTPPGPAAFTWGEGSDATNVWAISATNVVWRWDGSTWSTMLNHPRPLRGIKVLAPNNVYAIEDRAVLRYDGTLWTTQAIPVIQTLVQIAASAPDDIVVASVDALYHSDGVAWSPMRTPALNVNNTIARLLVHADRIELAIDGLGTKDVRALLRTQPWVCRPSETRCSDSTDDDCDGRIDALDPDCP